MDHVDGISTINPPPEESETKWTGWGEIPGLYNVGFLVFLAIIQIHENMIFYIKSERKVEQETFLEYSSHWRGLF